MKISLTLLPSWFAIALLVASLLSGSQPAAQAQFSSPAGQGSPRGGTAGGGSRGDDPSASTTTCPRDSNRPEALTVMAPTQSVGLVASARPTLWVYVPPTQATTLEFSLFNEQQDGLYQTNLPIRAPGWMALNLPANLAPLVPGQSYLWTIALICNPTRRSQDWLVEGWLRHQSPSPQLQAQLATATLDQRVTLYLEAGFWYEAVNTFMDLQRSQPHHPQSQPLWANLLKSAGLNLNPVPPRPTNASR